MYYVIKSLKIVINMCYRYSVPGKEVLEKKFKASFNKSKSFKQKYHVGFYDQIKLPVITNEEPEKINLFDWGLIPFWVKDQQTANSISKKTANARCESIFEKPSFRNSAEKKRCLVLADGFYEWRNFMGHNYPYFIHLKNNEPFAMAGLWDTWKNKKTNVQINSFSIITTNANTMLEIIHNKKKRMPVILKDEDLETWIDLDIDRDILFNLFLPFDENLLKAHTISKLISVKDKNLNVPDVKKPFIYPNIEPYFS
jgi:putative SOS response-associated peptidase YedK